MSAGNPFFRTISAILAASMAQRKGILAPDMREPVQIGPGKRNWHKGIGSRRYQTATVPGSIRRRKAREALYT